jgi:hypothetical protein
VENRHGFVFTRRAQAIKFVMRTRRASAAQVAQLHRATSHNPTIWSMHNACALQEVHGRHGVARQSRLAPVIPAGGPGLAIAQVGTCSPAGGQTLK